MSHSLIVTGGRDVDRVEMNADEYVSGAISILPTSEERLVLTVDGDAGGWLELVLNAHDGAVEEITITSPLPPYQPAPHSASLRSVPQLPCLAVGPLIADSRKVNFDRLVRVLAPLAEGRRDADRCVRVREGTAEVRYESYGLAFLVGGNGELLEFVICHDLAERARPFA
ncbi:hypothetical protein ACR9E3_03715 [Actinomycetospora sp. C-140]